MASWVVMAMALAAILFDPAHAQDEFYDSKIPSEWVDATLYCSNSTSPLPINDTDPVSWMLPDLTVLYFSTPKYLINDNNWTMVIRNATADDLGLYHCLIPIAGGNDYYLVKLGLNARGPYFQALWDKYMWNTIIGLSVAGGFAVLCVFLYLLDRFRYRSPKEEHDGKPDAVVYDNNGHVDVVELGHITGTFDEKENGMKKKDLGRDNPLVDAIYEDVEDGTKL